MSDNQNTTEPLFHLLTQSDWDEAQRQGEYRPASLAAEGFIHMSTREQVEGTLKRRFVGVPDLLVLTLDPNKFVPEMRFEDTSGHGIFPHLYGPLNLDAVTEVTKVTA